MGDYASDYVFLPVLEGPDGTKNVTICTGGGTNSGNLSITSACESLINLLKFFDKWYTGETVMQLQGDLQPHLSAGTRTGSAAGCCAPGYCHFPGKADRLILQADLILQMTDTDDLYRLDICRP